MIVTRKENGVVILELERHEFQAVWFALEGSQDVFFTQDELLKVRSELLKGWRPPVPFNQVELFKDPFHLEKCL